MDAHPISFSSTITYSASQPSGAAGSVSNWTGAAFDAANIGGSGTNADGGTNNGTANDASTFVANNQPVQGQTFTTGNNANGYDVSSFTVRMAGYTSNTATGSNLTSWNLSATNGPILIQIGRASGSVFSTVSIQAFMAGGTGTPGSGSSANGSGTYLTFNLPFPVHLDPGTTYAFDFRIGNGGSNFFEWLGTSANPFGTGTAYTRSGTTITPLTGDRVFMVNMTASATAYAPFVHPGTLHTAADFTRMASKIGVDPWKADFNILTASPWAQVGWPAYNVDYVVRGSSGNNYTRCQQDAQAIYELALRWKITGDASYADKAVEIANVWSDLLGVTGDSNMSLAAGLCGYLFAIGGEILSSYEYWPDAQKQAYKDMMMRVFYSANFDFLWRHHDTFWRNGGSTHYRLNWDTANMASMAAIGILCDNRAVYQQAVDFFKYGPGNGRVERAAWYVHPGGLGQGEEAGRDQGHNMGGWYSMALLCQMAWNQGDDLFAYDNNRVLRVWEYNAKYNLGNDVPYARHQTCDLGYTEGGVSGAGRGIGQYFQFELIYNHYVNVKGLAAPWSKLAVDATRPEPRPNPGIHPSQVDWLGLGSLTFARDAITTDKAPSGLRAHWSKNQVILDWWGSARATSYLIKRGAAPAGPFTQIGTVTGSDIKFTDMNVANGTTYYYVVTGVTPGGNLDSAPLKVAQELVTQYSFEGNASDAAGTRHATLQGGTTAPGFTTGFSGQAVNLSGANQYVQMPVGTANYQDITISTWVYWTGGNAYQRVFDFGSEIEKTMYLTTKNGSGNVEFGITTTKGGNVEGDASFYLRGSALTTNQWVHLAVTLNGDTGTLYVNGKPVAAKTIDLVDPLFGQPFCYLARSMWNSDPYFQGSIDDFRIYNYGLSGKEIYALGGQGGSNAAPAFSANPVPLPTAVQSTDYSSASQTLASFASDANGGTLTYAKVTGPDWLTVASNGALSGTPPNANVGVNTFVVRVTDSSGATDDATIYLTVVNVNDAPIWTSSTLTRPDVTRGQPYLTYTLAGSASDVDVPYGDSISFSKVEGPAWLTVNPDGSLSGTPGAGDVGVNTFKVQVKDTSTASGDAMLKINVLGYMLRSQYAFEGDATDGISALNGTTSGSPVYGTGRIGQGLVLDGTNDLVTLPAAAVDYQDFTVAAWVYWNGGGAYQRIFDFGDDTSHYMFLTPNSGSGLLFVIKNGDTSQQIGTTGALPTGTWVHVAVTMSGSTGTLYLNGSAVATSSSFTIHPGDFKPSKNYLGDSQFAADPLFSGRMDDVRIYNYAAGPAELTTLMNIAPSVPLNVVATPSSGRVGVTWSASQSVSSVTYTVWRSTTSGSGYSMIANGLTTTSHNDDNVTSGNTYHYVVTATNSVGTSASSSQVSGTPSDLLLHLKFNETSGSTATDSSGNNFNATLSGTPTFSAGYLENAVNFTTTAQYGKLPDGIVSALTDFTISAWVKVATLNTFSRIFDFGTSTTPTLTAGSYMCLTPQYTTTSPNAAKPRYAITTAGANGERKLDSSVAITVGTWNHIAITQSGNTAKLYVNGIEAGSDTGMTLKPSNLGVTTNSYLGKSQWSGNPTLNGALDDFRIYSKALTLNEIGALASQSGVPAPPPNLAATAGNSQIGLSWSAIAVATGYNVKCSYTSGGPYTTIATVTSPSHTHPGLVNGVTYYYVVSAVNGAVESANSAEASARSGIVTADWFTEYFSGATSSTTSAINDTAYATYTFTPASDTNGYVATKAAATVFPTSPTGGTAVSLTTGSLPPDDAYGTVTLTGSKTFPFIGTNYSQFYVGSNGYITFTSGDSQYSETLARHFNQRRISALFDDLDPSQGSPTISWKQLSDRVAVTWQNVRAYSDDNPTKINNFQIELFFDGKIQITILGINVTGGLIGLSKVTTTPTGYTKSDFSAYPTQTAPGGLSATGGERTVTLSWSATSGASGYWVKRATSTGGEYTTVGLTTSPSYTDTNLADGTAYYYVVSAVSMVGESPNSAEAGAITLTALQSWRMTNFGTTENAGDALDTADTDGDGMTNAQEFSTGTNPNDGTSALKVSQMSASGNAMIVSFPTVIGKSYSVEYSETLAAGSWRPVLTNGVPASNITATTNALQVTDSDGALHAKRFYRIIVP